MQGYCVKCRQKRDIVDAQQTQLKNGRPATRGKCGVCGTSIFVIGKGS
jgi:hypothetical protein